jgi:hypothetical protein
MPAIIGHYRGFVKCIIPQNLDNKGVSAWPTGFAYTAFALAIIGSLNVEVKVGCHNGAVENLGA